MTHSLMAILIRSLRLFRIVEHTSNFKACLSRALAVDNSKSSQDLSGWSMSDWKTAEMVDEGEGIRALYCEAGQYGQVGFSLP